MNIRGAIDETMDKFLNDTWTVHGQIDMVDEHLRHLIDMSAKINSDYTMSDGKLNRWLGWMQGVLCVCTDATLGEMKEINKKYAD